VLGQLLGAELTGSQETIRPLIAANVDSNATLVTAEWGGYYGAQFVHEVINHSVEYVNGHKDGDSL